MHHDRGLAGRRRVQLVRAPGRQRGQRGQQVVVDDGLALRPGLPVERGRGRRRDEELLVGGGRLQVGVLHGRHGLSKVTGDGGLVYLVLVELDPGAGRREGRLEVDAEPAEAAQPLERDVGVVQPEQVFQFLFFIYERYA